MLRRWHWRVAHEQLSFMHQDPPTPGGLPRFETIHCRVLLAAGGEDNEMPENLWDNTIDLAEQALHVQGHTMFLEGTGHAIVAERPRELAAELGRFFPTHSPEVTGAEPFGGWSSLGGDALRPNSLAAAPNEDGRLELCGIRVSDQRLVSQRQQRVNGDFPGAFEDIGVSRGVPAGVTFDSRLAAVPLHGGKLRLYALRSDENGWIVHFTQDQPNGVMHATDLGSRAFGQLLGGITEGPVVCERLGWNDPAHNPQRLHLVAGLNQNQHIKIRGQTVFEFPDRYWTDQPDLTTRTFTGAPALGRLQDGRLMIVARRPNRLVFFRAEDAPDKWTTDWQRVGDLRAASDPTLARDWQGRLNVFVTGDDGQVWRAIHDPASGNWAPWIPIGGQPAEGARPAIALDAWGGLEVFVRTTGNRLAYRREIPTGGFDWNEWTELAGTLTSDPIVAENRNGTLAVFGLDNDGRAQVITHSHPWSFGSERGVTGSRKNAEGDIIALCNPAEPWSPREVADVIADIESSTYTYVTVVGGIASEIQVVDGPHGKYLRTRPDATAANNLDNLPDC
jgi:hypothetical protein